MQRILAIHDLSGFGATSLMVVIPIMNRFGIQVCALPSAILSSNTCYADYVLFDTSSFMQESITHWERMGMSFSAIYSGFLGNSAQTEQVLRAINSFSGADCPVIIDPVMADDGVLYKCYDLSMVEAMRKLIARADIITPNFTEACLLCQEPCTPTATEEQVSRICHKLYQLGAQKIVITSVPLEGVDHSVVALFSPSLNSPKYFLCKYIPCAYPGTGDIFTSLLVAKLLHGSSIQSAIQEIVSFIYRAIRDRKSVV